MHSLARTSDGGGGDVPTAWRHLTWAMVVFALLVVAHDVDHIVNESSLYELPIGFWILLPIQYAAGLAVLALIVRRDRRAPLLAAGLGLIATAAFVVVHAVPFGPASYADTDAGFFNWTLVFVPAAVALYLGVTGLRLNAMRGLSARAAA